MKNIQKVMHYKKTNIYQINEGGKRIDLLKEYKKGNLEVIYDEIKKI